MCHRKLMNLTKKKINTGIRYSTMDIIPAVFPISALLLFMFLKSFLYKCPFTSMWKGQHLGSVKTQPSSYPFVGIFSIDPRYY